MNASSWICGLMAHNTDALGFIPATTVENRYVRMNRYVIQTDERGKAVGYLLHGAIRAGEPCVISQHCIEYDKRLHGYGELAFAELLRRCRMGGASSIHLRVGQDLPAVLFWQSCGFTVKRIVPGGERRGRLIVEMALPLNLPLFSEAAHE